jgi:hypothetical protein
MAKPNLRDQAERRRRLARGSTDLALRDSRLKLADEYAARASAGEGDDTTVAPAGSNDQRPPDRLAALAPNAATHWK